MLSTHPQAALRVGSFVRRLLLWVFRHYCVFETTGKWNRGTRMCSRGTVETCLATRNVTQSPRKGALMPSPVHRGFRTLTRTFLTLTVTPSPVHRGFRPRLFTVSVLAPSRRSNFTCLACPRGEVRVVCVCMCVCVRARARANGCFLIFQCLIVDCMCMCACVDFVCEHVSVVCR